MISLTGTLQRIVEKAQSRADTQAVLLRVQSGDRRIDFTGSAGAAAPDIRFPIAGISEIFTAATIRQLIDEGRLSPDRTVESLLPPINLSELHVTKGIDHGPRLSVR